MTDTRTETDSFGPIEVPASAYWGAQTERSIHNFPFGAQERMPIGIVHALAIVKQAAARVNRAHGLDATIADAISCCHAREVAGSWNSAVEVRPWNANRTLPTRADDGSVPR